LSEINSIEFDEEKHDMHSIKNHEVKSIDLNIANHKNKGSSGEENGDIALD